MNDYEPYQRSRQRRRRRGAPRHPDGARRTRHAEVRRDPAHRSRRTSGAGRCDRAAPLPQLISTTPSGDIPHLNAADRTTGCGNFLASSKQQEIVMTAKYPSIRRRLPASLFTLSLILAIAADPAAASETADDPAAAEDAAAQAAAGTYGGDIDVTPRSRQEPAQESGRAT